MNERRRTLVRESWLRCRPALRQSRALFSERVFALDPSLRRRFAGTDMAGQQRKLLEC